MMSKIRVNKGKNFSIVSNKVLRDTNLSIKARFILVFCLSLSDTWEYSIKGLAKVIGAGTDAISSGLKELQSHGYLERRMARDDRGRMRCTEYILHENPINGTPKQENPCTDNPVTENPRTENPVMENPVADNPVTENPPQINKDLNKNQINKYGLKQESKKQEPKEGKVPCEEIVALYNQICTSLPLVQNITSGRIAAMGTRWAENRRNIGVFVQLFTMAQESAFLTGDNKRGWKANFDWLMKPSNMAKVLEGNYVNGASLRDTAAEVARQMESEGW